MSRRAARVLGRVTAVLLLASSWGGGLGCGGTGDGQGRDRAQPSPDQADQADQAAKPDQPWRFIPTLEQHLPAGAVAQTVLELSQPRQRSVVVLAAVLRSGSEHVELERWTFGQNPDGESLHMVEGGTPLVRLRPGERHPELADLRRAVAAPRAVLTRPMGLPATEPKAALDALIAAFGTLHDPLAEPLARVQAAATVVRGLDDTVVLERDAVWELATLLDPPPGQVQVQALSDRRARITIERPGGTATLELQRKSDGWAISSAEIPKASPAPEPADTETPGGSTSAAPPSPG